MMIDREYPCDVRSYTLKKVASHSDIFIVWEPPKTLETGGIR